MVLKLKKTRFFAATKVAYACVLPGVWRHVDCNDGYFRPVGPSYASQQELLADHPRYLRDAGWLPPEDDLCIRVDLGRCSMLALCELRDFLNRYHAEFAGSQEDCAAVDAMELPIRDKVKAEIRRRSSSRYPRGAA